MLIIIPSTKFSHYGINYWSLLTLLTPLSFALCVLYINRYRPENLDDKTLSTGMLVMSSILLLPVVLYSGDFYYLSWPINRVSAVILLEIILSSVGYILFFRLIKLAGPVYYSLVSGAVCLTGLFWGWVIFSEPLTILMLTAVTFIVVAIILLTLSAGGQVD